jgi:hypothetical protein
MKDKEPLLCVKPEDSPVMTHVKASINTAANMLLFFTKLYTAS